VVSERAPANGLAQGLEVLLLQELGRLLLVDLLQGLEQAPLQWQEQVLFRALGQGRE
jgi:hypothetical protein